MNSLLYEVVRKVLFWTIPYLWRSSSFLGRLRQFASIDLGILTIQGDVVIRSVFDLALSLKDKTERELAISIISEAPYNGRIYYFLELIRSNDSELVAFAITSISQDLLRYHSDHFEHRGRGEQRVKIFGDEGSKILLDDQERFAEVVHRVVRFEDRLKIIYDLFSETGQLDPGLYQFVVSQLDHSLAASHLSYLLEISRDQEIDPHVFSLIVSAMKKKRLQGDSSLSEQLNFRQKVLAFADLVSDQEEALDFFEELLLSPIPAEALAAALSLNRIKNSGERFLPILTLLLIQDRFGSGDQTILEAIRAIESGGSQGNADSDGDEGDIEVI